MATERTLEMDFNTELGRTVRMRVYDAKETLTSTEVAAAMDNIVLKDIFTSNYGSLTDKIAARVVLTDTTDLELI